MRRTTRVAGTVLTVLLLSGLLAVPAAAHVSANPDEAHSPYFKVNFRVGHGCNGTPTTAVRVRIPDGVAGAQPEVAPGWDIELVRDDGETAGQPVVVGASYLAHDDEPGHDHGAGEEGEPGTATGAVTEVAWVGGSLPDAHVQEFGLSGRFTDDADDVVYFPVVQECEEGEHRWIDVPASLDEWGDLEEPAPYVRLAFRDGGTPNGDTTPEGDPATAEPAAEPAGDSEPGEGTGQEAAPDGGNGTDPLAVGGLVAGLLGLVAGGLALARTR